MSVSILSSHLIPRLCVYMCVNNTPVNIRRHIYIIILFFTYDDACNSICSSYMHHYRMQILYSDDNTPLRCVFCIIASLTFDWIFYSFSFRPTLTHKRPHSRIYIDIIFNKYFISARLIQRVCLLCRDSFYTSVKHLNVHKHLLMRYPSIEYTYLQCRRIYFCALLNGST